MHMAQMFIMRALECNKNLRIADVSISWPKEHETFIADFEVESDFPVAPEFNLSIESGLRQCHGIEYSEGDGTHFLHRAESSSEFLFANLDWSKATVYCENYKDENYELPLAALCARLANFGALLVHGSLIDFNGQGIIFSGYSGVGKTTQAQLWEKYMNAKIINGDKVFVRYMKEATFAYGSPWKGSSPYCLNQKVPLKAIVTLRQSPENSIKKLNIVECLEYFMPHIFLPHWGEESMSKAVETFDKILGDVPVYLLQCRPDEDAVIMTKEYVCG